MKKYKLLLLGSSLTLMFSACSVGDTDKGNTEVSSFEDLPTCTSKTEYSGTSFIGKKLYVDEDDVYYICTKNGWLQSDSTATEEPITNTTDSVVYAVEDEIIKGSAKLAAAFELGSEVKLSEVKFKNSGKTTEFVVTGNQYTDEISNKGGQFVISNVTTESKFALIEVNGLYQDIMSGEVSEDSIKLSALVDLTSDTALEVNLWTTLSLPRVKVLIENGYSPEAALIQAKKELMEVFQVAEAEEEAAALSLVVLFRQLNDEADFVEAIEDFAEDFAEDALWDDEKAITAMADFAYELENKKLIDEETNFLILKSSDIRKNLEKFGFVDAPAFEAYFTTFWNNAFGLGGCGSARTFAVRKNALTRSNNADSFFTCENNAWRTAGEIERDTMGLGEANDGKIAEGMVDDENQYVYDTTGANAGDPKRWRLIDMSNPADSMIVKFKSACTDEDGVLGKLKATEDEDENDVYWGCYNRKWNIISEFTFEAGKLCDSTITSWEKRIIKLEGKSKYRRCVPSEDSFEWTEANKVDYELRKSSCSDNIEEFDNDYYACDDSKKHTWRLVNALEEKLEKSCTTRNIGNEAKDGSDKYACSCIPDPMDPSVTSDDKNVCKEALKNNPALQTTWVLK